MAFGCNANSSQGGGIHHCFKFPTDPVSLKKWLVKIKRANFKPTKQSRLCAVRFETTCFERDPETTAALGFAGARVSLKSNAVPSIFPAVEAAFMPSIHRIHGQYRRPVGPASVAQPVPLSGLGKLLIVSSIFGHH